MYKREKIIGILMVEIEKAMKKTPPDFKCYEIADEILKLDRQQGEIKEIKVPLDNINATSWSQVSAMLAKKSNEHTRIINQYLLGKTFYPDNNNAEEQDVESIIESETTEEDYQFTEKGFGPNKK